MLLLLPDEDGGGVDCFGVSCGVTLPEGLVVNVLPVPAPSGTELELKLLPTPPPPPGPRTS